MLLALLRKMWTLSKNPIWVLESKAHWKQSSRQSDDGQFEGSRFESNSNLGTPAKKCPIPRTGNRADMQRPRIKSDQWVRGGVQPQAFTWKGGNAHPTSMAAGSSACC